MKKVHTTQVLVWSLLAGIPLAAFPTETAVTVVSVPTDALPTPYDAGFVRFLVPSARTEGRIAVLELQEVPGFETPWHQHKNFDETFYVLEGALTVRLKDKTLELPVGSSIFIPRGTAHAQGSFTEEPVRVLTTFTPGGFDQFFADRAELFKSAKPGTAEFTAGMRKLRVKHAHWIQEPDSMEGHP